MKTTLALKIVTLSLMITIPTIHASPATSQTLLIRGTTHLIDSVDVQNLPETGQSNAGQNIQVNLHSQGAQAFDQGKSEIGQSGYVPPSESSKIVATATAVSNPLAANVGLVLEGAPGSSPNPCACSPPDPNNGVGPNHVFEMVNLAGIIYTKAGAVAKATFGLDGFFGLPASSMSDPTIMYDSISGRWFASIINIPGHTVVFAVSTTNDPTGTFLLYSVSAGNNLADQPFIGTNDDKFVISTNDFNSRGTRYLGVQYWVLNKSQLVNGAATIDFVTITPDSTMFTLRPARHLTSSTTFYMVTDCTGSCVPDPQSTSNTETVISITGLPPAAVTVSLSSFSIATTVIGPNAAQPGTSTTLTTNDNRVESVVWESNSLWASWNDACIPSGDTVTRTCLRLVQATTSGVTATKTQDFDFAASGQYYFYPAVTSYQGQLAVVFGQSSGTIYPSLLVSGRASSDPINTLQAPATIRSGTAPDTSTRYGDYFGAATDPSPTATSTFWVAGEYRASSTAQNWNTAIGRVGAFSPLFDYSVIVSPTIGSLVRGSNMTATVTVSLISGTPQSVGLSASVLPVATGLTVGVNPTSGSPNYTSTLTISTATSTPAGKHNVTITGTTGSLTHNTTVLLIVTIQSLGTIVIKKTITNGGDGLFNFTSTATGTGTNLLPAAFQVQTTGGTGNSTFTGVDTRLTYSVSEASSTKWRLLGATCTVGSPTSFTVSNSSTTTCTFNNENSSIIHDVAVTGLVVQRPYAYNGVFSYPIRMNITVANVGSVSETFTVSAWYNSSQIGGPSGGQIVTLTSGSNKIVPFLFYANRTAIGKYTISGRASQVPREINLANNVLTMSGMFQVRKAGDVDGDGAVDITDVMLVYTHQFTTVIPSPYDIDNDGGVDLTDVIVTYTHQFL